MKKNVLACVFAVVALMCFGGCKNKTKGADTPHNEPTIEVYKIGDEGPGGGIVFYVSKEGFYVHDGKGDTVLCHYLEMSKNALGECKWFPKHGVVGTYTGLGHGRANTYKILNASKKESLTEDNCAAYMCSKYSTTSTEVGEWWLPSKDELNLIYKNKRDDVLATCTSEYHWTSSEFDYNYTWGQNFVDGDWHHSNKIFKELSVRAVRAF